MSLKSKIYWSFTLLVILFIVNAIATLATLSANKKMASHISSVMDPSVQKLEELNKLVIESRMYVTNWVFLRYNEEDKESLRTIHDKRYKELKESMTVLFQNWETENLADSLKNLFSRFEKTLQTQQVVMHLLSKFQDYNDPIIKLETERILEDELIPEISGQIKSLNIIINRTQELRLHKQTRLEAASKRLRLLCIIMAITIIIAGILLSQKMARGIISPINRIVEMVNELGKGVTRRIHQKGKKDEIGTMITSINTLSTNLEITSNFAKEIGLRNFNTAFEPLGDDDTLGKALLTMRDNLKTSEEQLIDANDEIQAIYNASPDAVVILDEEGRIVKWDHKAELLFGWEEKDVMGSLLSKTIVPTRYHEDPEFGLQSLFNRMDVSLPGQSLEALATHKHKTEFAIRLSISSAVIKDKYRFIGFIRDITRRKNSELELQRKNKELEQFAYVASHDLQEPLRTTASFVELLQEQYKGKFDADADKYLSYIVHASDRMQVLINDLLEYSRIGHKKQLETVDCNVLMNEVQEDIGKAISESGATIQSADLPVIKGYSTELKQLFQNLITNAIKFRKNDTSPQIGISVARSGVHWKFSVSDNGIGIDEKHRDRIFVIFQRLHTRSEYEGSGIGLAHCKKIVELHGGKIWIESTPQLGSKFHFTILQNNN